MNILIAGASGFIGNELVAALKSEHKLTLLGREKKTLTQSFGKSCDIINWSELEKHDAKNFDCVINLCGFNIAGARWSQKMKQQLIDSRVDTTKTLVQWIINKNARPHFLCANAVGIYGLQENGCKHHFDEFSHIDFAKPRDFMSEIGVRWQQATQLDLDYGMPITTMRFGVVLGKNGGMLKKLIPSFRLGLGAIIGDGRQMLSWIDINDLIAAIKFLIAAPQLIGAFNVTAPNPVSQAEFAKTMAKVMHKRLFMKLPAFLVHLLFGEMGECLLLKGQAVIPKRLLDEGFKFTFPNLHDALEHELTSI